MILQSLLSCPVHREENRSVQTKHIQMDVRKIRCRIQFSLMSNSTFVKGVKQNCEIRVK